MTPRRRGLLVAIAVVVVAGAAIGAVVATRSELTPQQRAAIAFRRQLATETKAVGRATPLVNVHLPLGHGEAALAPAIPARLFRHPIPAHQVFGYVPYWEMASLTPSDYHDATELAYYGPAVGAGGAIVKSGPAWTDIGDAAFTSFVTSAHGAGDRVLLTVSTTALPLIDGLVAAPAAAAARLVEDAEPVLAANDLDGLDLDIEGRGAADRAGFATFVADVASRLRATTPSSQLVVNTYPQSASGDGDFFDISSIARHVDLIFIMGYAMNSNSNSSAGAPLASPTLGWSDVQTMIQYTKEAPASKLILGSPFYGIDFSTEGSRPGSPTRTAYPLAVTYASILAVGRPAYWDPDSFTVYTRFRRAGKWHQTWYDNPLTLALKTSLAARYHLAGVGAWAFGMEGGDTAMLNALVGTAPPVKLGLTPVR